MSTPTPSIASDDTATAQEVVPNPAPQVIVLSSQGMQVYDSAAKALLAGESADEASSEEVALVSDALLQGFLSRIKMSDDVFTRLVETEKLKIRNAAGQYYEGLAWKAKLAQMVELGKAMYDRANGEIKIFHDLDNLTTIAYRIGPIPCSGPGIDPDDMDWGVTLAFAQPNEGEPYSRRIGKAMALSAMARNRTVSFNLSAIPGHTKAEPPAWGKGHSFMKSFDDAFVRMVHIARTLVPFGRDAFGNRRGRTPTAVDIEKERRARLLPGFKSEVDELRAAKAVYRRAQHKLRVAQAQTYRADDAGRIAAAAKAREAAEAAAKAAAEQAE
jgi:hypothetical protein